MSMSETETLPIFLCYRQRDGSEQARRLYQLLDGQPIELGAERRAVLRLFFDKEVGAVQSFNDHHRPALERARSMIVLITPGLGADKSQGAMKDWVHVEIQWWIRHRRDIDPILIDTTGDGGDFLPRYARERWAGVNRVDYADPRIPEPERETVLRDRILKGVIDREVQVRHQDLHRLRTYLRTAIAASILSTICLLLASLGWSFAEHQKREANRARDDANKATNEARLWLANSLWHRGLSARDKDGDDPLAAVLLAQAAIEFELGEQKEQSRSSLMAIPRGLLGTYLHDGPVHGAAFADGSNLLTWSKDGTARYWNGDRNELIQIFDHQQPVKQAAHSARSDRVLTLATDGTAKLWRVKEGDLVATLDHKAPVLGGLFSEDGSLVLTWGKDGTARLWSADHGKPLQVWRHGEDGQSIGVACFLGAGSHVLTLKDDGTAQLWEVGRNEPIRTYRYPANRLPILQVAPSTAPSPFREHQNQGGPKLSISPDQSSFLTWGFDKAAWLWDVDQDEPIRAYECNELVTGAAIAWGRSRVMTWDDRGDILDWGDGPGGQARPLQHPSGVHGAWFNSDESEVITACADGMARVWVLANGAPATVLGHDRPVSSATFAGPDRILTCTDDGTLWLWSRAGSSYQRSRKFSSNSQRAGADASADFHRVMIYGEDGAVRIWRTDSDAPVAVLNDPVESFTAGGESALALTRGDVRMAELRMVPPSEEIPTEGRNLFLAAPVGPQADDIRFCIFDVLGRKVRDILTGPSSGVADTQRLQDLRKKLEGLWTFNTLVENERGGILEAIAEVCGYLPESMLWDLEHPRPEPIRIFSAKDPVQGIRLSQNGSRLLIWGGGKVRLLDYPQGQTHLDLELPNPIVGAELCKEGGAVLTWDEQGMVQFWEPGRPEPTRSLRLPGKVRGVCIDPSGSILLGWGAYAEAELWSLPENRCIGKFNHGTSISGAFLHASSKKALFWGDSLEVSVWDLGSGKRTQTLKHSVRIIHACITEDQSRIVTWLDDGTAILWEFGNEEPVGKFALRNVLGYIDSQGHMPSPDHRLCGEGSRLVSWSRPGTIAYWDADLERPIRSFGQEDERNGFCCASITASETYLLGFDLGHTARVWRLGGGQVRDAHRVRLEQEILAGGTIDPGTGRYRLLKLQEWLDKRKQAGALKFRSGR